MISIHNNSFATYIRQGKIPDGTSYLCDRDGALPDVKESGTAVWHGCPCSGRSDVRIRRDGWMGRFRETRGSHVPAVSGSTGQREEL